MLVPAGQAQTRLIELLFGHLRVQLNLNQILFCTSTTTEEAILSTRPNALIGRFCQPREIRRHGSAVLCFEHQDSVRRVAEKTPKQFDRYRQRWQPQDALRAGAVGR